jgi:hypothetical protein
LGTCHPADAASLGAAHARCGGRGRSIKPYHR